MTTVDILVPAQAGPAAFGLTIDALDAANRIAGASGSKPFDWRALAIGAGRVELRHGLTMPAQRMETAKPRDILVVLCGGAAGPEEIELRLGGSGPRAATAG